MKKLLILFVTLLFAFSLASCNTTDETELVTVPDFTGISYGDAVRLAFSVDLKLDPSSEYSDDVDKNLVFYQSIEEGTEVDAETTISITYSDGLSPDGVITLPDFTGMTDDEIQQWIYDEDITSYTIRNSFDPGIGLGEFVGLEIDQVDESNPNYLRKDEYNFLVSRGPLEVEEVEFNPNAVRGVNLGGWFVLEGWMTSELFRGVDGSDETAFMQQVPDAATVIEEHWDTFITEDDFIWLADHDVEYVRIPIPWWLFGESYYEGTEHEVTYASSVFYIDRAMTWAEDHNIKVLLDLHTAPGCQNGFDNGGVAGLLEWDKPENVQLTLTRTRDIIQHFAQFDSLWGYEVLNEPASWGINMTTLRNFYEDAYDVIRIYAPDIWIGFHDAFTGGWGSWFDEQDMDNVFLDTHLYQVFGDGWGDMDIVEHVDFVHTQQYQNVHQYGSSVPVIVGEWSLGLPGSVYDGLDGESVISVKAAFMNAQLNVYESGMGWFFWNYKIENGGYYKEWSYVEMVAQGFFPENYNQE
jgi:glucan 1,3-beta-glucosidase